MWTTRPYQTRSRGVSPAGGLSLIQPKLKVGKPGDKYEQEADRVADTVMRMPDRQIQRQPVDDEEGMVQMQSTEDEKELQMQPMEEEEELQMKCKDCEEKEKMQMKPAIQMQEGGAAYASQGIVDQINSTKGQGSPLAPDIQREMSTKMGADFSDVQVHTDVRAVQMSQALGAKAFTVGRKIYFNANQYAPKSSQGKRLLAHELTHTVQPNGNHINRKVIQCELFPSDDPTRGTRFDQFSTNTVFPKEEAPQFTLDNREWVSLQTQSPEESATVNTTYCNRPLPQNEVDERDRILNDFTRGLPDLNESVRRVLISSICDFSLNQLNMMKEAGLRFWMGSGVPPVFEGEVQRSTFRGSASYANAIRTIFFGNRVNPGYATHEMAHAWDHIRNLSPRRRVRLDDITNYRRRRNLMTNPGEYLTEADRPQDIQIDDRPVRKRFSEMHAAYNSRVPRRELAFSGSSRLGYSQTDPQEFYAEGYTVFHGNSINQQAKLYKYARELYAYLLSEARDQQMPVPDINEVRREARQLPAPQ